mmetsp:Transcript_20860/g.31683  ORF Transcript_20860/g.31683 Transcript_20860/m.31683 type:complete len:186 (-) Transcript_20860:2357-2914(-)
MKITLFLLLSFNLCIGFARSACASCLASSVIGSSLAASMNTQNQVRPSAMTYIAIRQLSTHFGTNIVNKSLRSTFAAENGEKDGHERERQEAESDKPKADIKKPPVTVGMVAAIGLYKNWISPLLPPACRFLPTCSQYGVQAIEEYGPGKGIILTSWRLLRCSPFGGKGYDPPTWPPVKFTHGSY